MNRFIISVLAVLVLASLSPAPAQAQGGEQMIERLQAELEITEQVLTRAGELVNGADDDRARTILKLAVERQEWARDQVSELQGQFRLRLHAAAMTATEKAREQARNAIGMVNQSDRHEGMVSRRLERTEQLLEQIRLEGQDGPDGEHLRELYETARRTLDRAWEFHREANYRPALKLGNQANSTAQQILRALRSGDGSMEEFERRQSGLNQKLEQARERLQCEWVKGLLDEAEEAYMEALNRADKGEPEMARRMLMKSNELLNQAVRNCTGLDDVENGIERIKQQLGELNDRKESLDNEHKDAFEGMLKQARQQVSIAERYLNEKNYEAAKISVQAAYKAVAQARRMLELY